VPILCVGESEQERDAEETERKLRHQIQEDLAGVAPERLADVVIRRADLGDRHRPGGDPEQAQEAIAFVRALIGDRDADAAASARILYGGSVKPENALELLALPDVDGALVGGASLQADAFAAIVQAARGAR
jgi:triosephosphate isomerase